MIRMCHKLEFLRNSKLVLLPFLSLHFLQFVQVDGASAVYNIDSLSFNETIANHEIVFVNFYAEWCRFSQNLKPIFEDAAQQFSNQQPPARIIFAAVDCDRNPDIATKYNVNKYPTLKMFRNGELMKKEYRGQRSSAALADFVRSQAESPVEIVDSNENYMMKVANTKHVVVGRFVTQNNTAQIVFARIASTLRDDCKFLIATGDWTNGILPPYAFNTDAIFFRGEEGDKYEQYYGLADNYDYVKKWLTDKCVPLVREITFSNAEELTEEGLPFLILFRNNDIEAEKLYKEAVIRELGEFKNSLNCLMADGKRFAHPLHHLGKSERDLPVIAIDSFRHMYLFPDFNDIRIRGKLKQFVTDLNSGKLHREFHHGPDPTKAGGGTQPPESTFNKLKPSENRYSLLGKEEL